MTLNGFSKAYAMTGWRLGYLAAPRALLEPIVKVHQFATVCSPPFVQAGGVAAYRGDQGHARMMRDAFAARLEVVRAWIERIDGLVLAEPAGAFYAFPEITAPGWSSTGPGPGPAGGGRRRAGAGGGIRARWCRAPAPVLRGVGGAAA